MHKINELQNTVNQLQQQLAAVSTQMQQTIEPALQYSEAHMEVLALKQQNLQQQQRIAELEYRNQVLLAMCTVQECDMQKLKQELTVSNNAN
jgi:hypothetical protein